jgi:hypothetical protein
MKTPLFICLAFLFCLTACKKTNDTVTESAPELSGIYQTSPFIEPGPLVMFTANGKITDQGLIRSCVTRKLIDVFVFPMPGFETPYDYINLTTQPKLAADTLKFDFSDPQHPKYISRWETFVTDQTMSTPYFIFKRVDSTYFGAFPDFSRQYFSPVVPSTCQLVSSTSNSYFCTWRNLYAIGYENNNLYIPRTGTFLFTGNSNTVTGGSGVSFRFLNDSASKWLNIVDTLIYQENRWKLIKI